MPPQTVQPTRARWLGGALAALVIALLTAGMYGAQAAPPQSPARGSPLTGTPTTTTTATVTVTTTPASPTPTATVTETPGTPTPTPIFTCCEEKIHIRGEPQNIRITRHKNVLAPGSITIQLDFEVDLGWHCKQVQDQECRVYYEVSTNAVPWQEKIKKEWKNIPWVRVNEDITTDPPIVTQCDGKNYKGTWKFSLKWGIASGRDVRHENLAVRLRFPQGYEKKGTQYTFLLSVDADRTKPRLDVTIKDVKVIQPK